MRQVADRHVLFGKAMDVVWLKCLSRYLDGLNFPEEFLVDVRIMQAQALLVFKSILLLSVAMNTLTRGHCLRLLSRTPLQLGLPWIKLILAIVEEYVFLLLAVPGWFINVRLLAHNSFINLVLADLHLTVVFGLLIIAIPITRETLRVLTQQLHSLRCSSR